MKGADQINANVNNAWNTASVDPLADIRSLVAALGDRQSLFDPVLVISKAAARHYKLTSGDIVDAIVSSSRTVGVRIEVAQ